MSSLNLSARKEANDDFEDYKFLQKSYGLNAGSENFSPNELEIISRKIDEKLEKPVENFNEMVENRKIDRNDLEIDSGSDMPLAANAEQNTIHGGPTTACTTLLQA